MASMIKWVRVEVGSASNLKRCRMFNMVTSATPPEDGGGADTTV